MLPITKKRWIPRAEKYMGHESQFKKHVQLLVDSMQLHPLVAQILVLRGIYDPKEVELHLNGNLSQIPDPFKMTGMDRAVKRIAHAIWKGEAILISGDFDVDGCTGTALLVQFLREVGGRVNYFIPLRERDGYGLNARILQSAAEKGYSLVISVDCGISAVEEAAAAKHAGLDLIIGDHHQPPESLPDAFAIINPHQKGCAFPYKDLAGVGVAFFLAIGIRKALRDTEYFKNRPEPDLKKLLDLVCLGTIADLVPLSSFNKILTKAGLKVLQGNARPGLACLKDVAKVSKVSSGTVAFSLGPRLNAAGRLNDASLGVELLLAESAEKASGIAQDLNKFNQQRQELEQRVVEHANKVLEREGPSEQRTIVLAHPEYHPGVIGICAGRITEMYHRPTVFFSLKDGLAKGSARSIKGLNLFHALQECSDLLVKFGGHEAAAGMTVEESSLPEFKKRFEAVARKHLAEEDLIPSLKYDVEIPLGNLNISLLETLETLGPFGMGNPTPVFVSRRVLPKEIRVVGTNHLSFVATQDNSSIRCIAFKMGSYEQQIKDRPVDILYSASINEWQGRRTPQAEIKDFRILEK